MITLLVDANKQLCFDDTVPTLRGAEKTRFKRMLETLLADVPDTLTVQEAAELTGYAESTILRYICRRYIYAVRPGGSITFVYGAESFSADQKQKRNT